MRIMTNYLQILAAAMSFNLHFPSYMTNALSGAKQVGNSSGVLLSFDWLLMESDLSSSFGNIAFLKVTMIALIPIAFLSAAALGLGLVFIKNRVKFKRYLWVTAITVFFLLHPTLTQYCLRIFKCNDIGNGQSRVEMDIQTPCWDPHHLKWVYFLGIPMLILYVIGFPVAHFVILFIYRNKLSEPYVLRYFLLLYQGVKHNRYYWELVNTFRKSMLLMLHVFVPDTYKVLKALFGAFVLFLCSILQGRLKPFKIGVVTNLEYREMMSSTLTLYGGLIFIQEGDELEFLHIVIFVLIVIINVRFILLWIFWVVTVYKRFKYLDLLSIWLKRSFWIHISEEDEDKMWYRSRVTTTEGVVYIYKTGNSNNLTKNKSVTWSKNVTDKPLSKDKSDRVTSNLELENMTSNKWPNFSKMDKMKSSYLTSDSIFQTDNQATPHKILIRGPNVSPLEMKKEEKKEPKTSKPKLKKKKRRKLKPQEVIPNKKRGGKKKQKFKDMLGDEKIKISSDRKNDDNSIVSFFGIKFSKDEFHSKLKRLQTKSIVEQSLNQEEEVKGKDVDLKKAYSILNKRKNKFAKKEQAKRVDMKLDSWSDPSRKSEEDSNYKSLDLN